MPAMNAPSGRRARRLGGWDPAVAVFCGALVAALSAAHLTNGADAAHDAGVARVLGLDAQPWRAADVLVGHALAWAPLGTRAARAGLASGAATGAAAAIFYGIVRRVLATLAETRVLGSAIAAIVTCTAAFSAPWQVEAGAVGGSGLGVALSLLPLLFLLAADERPALDARHAWTGVAFSLGLAFGYEPLVALCACAGCAAPIAADRSRRKSLAEAVNAHAIPLAAAWAAGLSPWIVAVAHTRALGEPLASMLVASWAGERGAGRPESVLEFARLHLGPVLGLAAVAGAVLAALVPRARPSALALAALVACGAASAFAGAPLGPTRFGAPSLVALAAVLGLAAVALQAIVRAVASANVPFARASAAMVLLLEAVIPVDAADDALAVGGVARLNAARAAAAWDAAAWATLPPEAVALVGDDGAVLRARAARAEGRLRADIAVVDLDAKSGAWRRDLGRDPAFVPLWRDLALSGSPTESSLSSLATVRPLFVSYDPRWGVPMSRHLVPAVLLDRFEPEPRGVTDRRRALDAFAPVVTALDARTAGDPDLRAASERLLRLRAAFFAAAGATALDHALAERTAAAAAVFAH
jgi:hypothetical protein